MKALAAKNAYIILIGNKTDLESDREIEENEADEFAKRYGIVYIETSAKTGLNIEESVKFLVNYLVQNDIHPYGCDASINKLNINKREKDTCCKQNI